MSRHGTYDPKYGFVPDDDEPQTYLCDSCSLFPCDDSGVKMVRRCPAYNPKPKPKTNGDRIREMSDEELAWELCRIQRMPFYKDDNDINEYEVDCWAKWLKEEYKE